MRKLFLSSSFAEVADRFVAFMGGTCEGKTVTFIPTASLPEKVTFYVAAGKKALLKRGMIVDELELSTATPEEISSKLTGNDYIYLTGGNTFFLLQELRRTGADQLISAQIATGKPYIGESAGSMILARDLDYVTAMDDVAAAPELTSLNALGVVDFYPLPHHTNFPFKKVVEKIIGNYADKIPLHPISNRQAIQVDGDQVVVIDK